MFYVDKEKCNVCGDCVDACPQGAINIRNGTAVIENTLCGECGMCFSVCAVEAIREKVVSSIDTARQVDTKWERREVNTMPMRGWFGGASPMWDGGNGMSRVLGRGCVFGRGGGYRRGQFGRGQGFGMGRGRPSFSRGFGRRW